MGEQASGYEGISCCHILTPELSTRQLFTHFFPSLEGGAAEPGEKKKAMGSDVNSLLIKKKVKKCNSNNTTNNKKGEREESKPQED